jgi:hypothetical protein
LADDGYMNEKHMGVVERTLLSLSGERRRIREAASELAADGAESHLVEALNAADRELAATYKRLFQDTYFHVSDAQLENAGRNRQQREASAERAHVAGEGALNVPEPSEEMRLFKAEEAPGSVKP